MKTPAKLAINNLKTAKVRSCLTGVAIFLTTMLITIIAFGSNAAIREQKDNAAKLYGEHYGTMQGLTLDQIKTVTLHSQFHHIGMETYAGQNICKGYMINLYETDLTARALTHFQIESGNYPEAENEILASREIFKLQGYKNPGIGDTVILPIRINGIGEIIQKEFQISGFLPSSKSSDLAKRYLAYVSESFIRQYIPKEENRSISLKFQVFNDEDLNSEQMIDKIEALTKEIGLKENQVNVNTSYLLLALEPSLDVLVSCICILFIIMIVSALVIYNIFHIAVIQKIREFGRLKALGADRKQLKHMVFTEGLILSCLTIPAGIVFGILLLKIVLCTLMQENIRIFSLPLTIVTILLTLGTVFVSIKKPMKLASKTSPVEAIRYEAGKKERRRKGMVNISVFGLTMSNLALHKKRTAATILTMGLSCVLFVVVANVAGNMDALKQTREDLEYGKFRIELDTALHDTTYPENNMNEVQKLSLLGDDFIQQLKSIPGVTEIRTRRQIPVYETNENTGRSSYVTISVVNEEEFEWLKRNAARGVVDYRTTAESDGVIYMWDYFLDDEYSIGDLFHAEILDGDRRIPFSAPILGSCGHSNDGELTMTDKTFEKLGLKEDMTDIVFVDCTDEAEKDVRAELEQLINAAEHLTMTYFQDTLELTELSISFTRNTSYSLLVILGIIGFMNMVNTMITNILTRKREFGILQAVGMSNRQLNQMLQLEGLVFTAGTLLISLIPGNLLGYYAFLFCKEQGFVGLFEYHPPLLELSVFVIGIVALQGILAFVLSRNIKKESIVVRIRQTE